MRIKALTSLLASLLLVINATAQYRIATPGYQYQFPRDHFDHPHFQTEWWYYTGNLKSPDGHRFGFELTFFREGVNREPNRETKTNGSPWDVRDIYVAHFALSDITGQRFYQAERTSRSGPGLAGISEDTGRIWNGNWQVLWNRSEQQLSALTEQWSIRLATRSQKPPAVHGLNGLSQKSAGAGHASHYVSFTRLLTSGSIAVNGAVYDVSGSSWMDHEFFTNQLAADEPGWDWVSIQLSDNTELMVYRLRHRDGTIDPFSSATYVDAEGHTTHISSADFTMQPSRLFWNSNQTKAQYPIGWHISVPYLDLELNVSTPLQSQEVVSTGQGTPSYWEGAIDISGHRRESSISGVGYLEMTGYAEPVHF